MPDPADRSTSPTGRKRVILLGALASIRVCRTQSKYCSSSASPEEGRTRSLTTRRPLTLMMRSPGRIVVVEKDSTTTVQSITFRLPVSSV
jgi:hypothetical protein